MNIKNPSRKANGAIVAVLLASFILVGVNLGEFWPFSIYPMFSQGGNSWSRALVREIAPGDSVLWTHSTLDDLPGDPFSVHSFGVDHIDLANFVSKTTIWSPSRVEALEQIFFRGRTPDRRLLIFRVTGEMSDSDEVVVTAIPYVLLQAETNRINPRLMP